jgi:hypothetical protein
MLAKESGSAANQASLNDGAYTRSMKTKGGNLDAAPGG